MTRERRLSNEERNALARRLQLMRRQVLDELAEPTAPVQPEAWTGVGEVHTHADQAEAEREQDLLFAEAQIDRTRLEAIEQAIQRLADGRYGICIDCGQEIARDRLLAQSFAIRCAPCQAALQAQAVPGPR